MDFPIIVLAVFVLGTGKVILTKPGKGAGPAAETGAGGTPSRAREDIPVGRNLELRREPGAFTAIVKEMGLM